MKFVYVFFLIFSVFLFVNTVDDDFSEFNDPDDTPSEQINTIIEQAESKEFEANKASEPVERKKEEPEPEKVVQEETVDQETDESNYLQDSEEFEGYDKDKRETGKPDLKIVKVPHHLTTSWENYYLELLMITGLVVYFGNFVKGKTRNNKLANTWFESHKEMLEENFSLVGDDGSPTPKQGELNKESENMYNLWCSGRVGFEGMLVELKLLKRQDLVSVVSRMMRPQYDQINVKVILDDTEMDGFVMCIANKKRVNMLLKDYQDLATFCPDKKSLKGVLPDSFTLLTEISEASTAIIDSKVQRIFKDFEDNIEYIHISDQYTGPNNSQDDQNAKLPEVKRCIMFGFKVGNKGSTTTQQMESTITLIQLVLYIADKARRVRLSKDARARSERNRQKAAGSYEKAVHLQRQEAAQLRRQEKMRQEKEKLLAEEDPERARKLEISRDKREAKNKQPKVKMFKMK